MRSINKHRYFKLYVLYHILHLLQNYNTIPPMPYLMMLSMKEEVNSYPKWIVSWDKINEVKQETMKAVFDEWPQQNAKHENNTKCQENLGIWIQEVGMKVLYSISGCQILEGHIGEIQNCRYPDNWYYVPWRHWKELYKVRLKESQGLINWWMNPL